MAPPRLPTGSAPAPGRAMRKAVLPNHRLTQSPDPDVSRRRGPTGLTAPCWRHELTGPRLTAEPWMREIRGSRHGEGGAGRRAASEVRWAGPDGTAAAADDPPPPSQLASRRVQMLDAPRPPPAVPFWRKSPPGRWAAGPEL